MDNIDEIIGRIAERTREAVRDWDIDKTIQEVRQTEEIKELQAEIDYLSVIDGIFTGKIKPVIR